MQSDAGKPQRRRGFPWVKTETGYEPTDERMKQIVEWIRAGRPYRLIAFNFGITIARVSAIRRQARIPRRKQPVE